jgi:ribonuclease J
MPPEEVTILASGSQGEPFSALSRMGVGEHKWIEIGEGDTVILSASAIPGNESMILRNIDNLFRAGARVIYGRDEGVHVSGHGNREELRLMLSLTRPQYAIPVHGDYRHLVLYRDLAVEMDIPEKNVLLMGPGISYEFRGGKAYRAASVPSGSINVDGLGVGDVGEVVLNDRQVLAEEGIVLPVVALDAETGDLVGGPDIYSRGFVYMNEAGDIVDELTDEVWNVYEGLAAAGRVDPEVLYDRLRSAVTKRVVQLTGRRPMVLPVIIPVGADEEAEGPKPVEGVDPPGDEPNSIQD